MSAVTSQAPSTNSSSTRPYEPDIEPDEQWKLKMRTQIEQGLQSMVQDAKDNLQAELMKAPVGAEERERLTQEYSDAMANIRKLAAEGFQVELERERQERRWASGKDMLPQWSQALKEEQQDILDRIKKSSSGSKPPESVGDVRPPPSIPKPPPREIPQPVSYPIPELPVELQRGREEKERRDRERERDRERDRAPLPVHPTRRSSDTHGSEYSQTFRHATYNLLPVGSYAEPVLDSEFTDDPEEMLRPPERYRSASDRPPPYDRAVETPVSRSIERQSRSVSDRHTTHSPPKPIPEVWKPAITPEDDARMSKPFPLGRRGSTASIRSTGSGSIRPSIAEAIPERADDIMEIAQARERERPGDVEQEWAPIPIDKARERERPISSRNESRQSVASDHSQRYDDPGYGRTSTRPSDHHGGSYGPLPRPRHQSSFTADDREYSSYGPHTGTQRPLVPRASFNEERPYLMGMGAYPTSSPTRPISHKQSFTKDDHDRYYDTPPPRPYPTPPSSASRTISREYSYQDGYDPRADNSYRERDREPRSNTWKVAQQMPDSPSLYRRSSESRPVGWEPSFSRGRPDLGPVEDPYPSYEYAPPTSSIPISRSRQSPITDDTSQNWKGWAEQPPLRSRDYRFEPEYRGPPYSPDGRPPGPRSPPSSYQGHRDTSYHNFGGRSTHQDREDYFENDVGSYRYYRETQPEHRRKEEPARDVVESRQREEDAELEAEMAIGTDVESDTEIHAKEEARERERKREEEAAKEEARRYEEVRRKEEEARIKEEETKRKEEEMRWKEEEARRKEEEARKKAEEAERRAAEAKKKEIEAKKKEEDARRKEAEAKRKEEEARRKEEEAERKEAETKRKEKEIKKKEQEVKRKEAEAKRMENEAKQKEEETKRREADAQRKELEAKKKEAEAKKREEAARRKSAEAAQKEIETQKKEDEIRQREEELRRREEELARREEESNRKEIEQKQREDEASLKEAMRLQAQFDEEIRAKEAERKRDEERRQREHERYVEEMHRRAEEEKLRQQQQEEFRRREEEIRRRTDERKRQDSVGAESAWGPQQQNIPPRAGPQRNGAGSSPSTERNGTTASSWGGATGSAWSSSTFKSSTASSNSSVPPNRPGSSAPPPSASKPRAGSMGSSFAGSPPPTNPASSMSEEEWQNRQNDYSWQQQERFREEQAALEAARLKMGKGKILSKDEVLRIFARHEQQWEALKSSTELRWRNFPWPMMQPPSSAEDITYRDIDAYIQSPHYPEGDKSKAPKDRIKEQLRNWHPDRFDTKYLPKVIDEEKVVVKEGAGSVVRTLNELLQRMNTPVRPMWPE